MIWFILSLIPSFIYLFYKSQKSLQMLQQNWYDDGNRYLKWLFNNLGRVLGNIDVLIILLVFFNRYVGLVFGLFYVIMFILNYFFKKQEQNKKPLVITSRVKRLYLSMYLLLILLIAILGFRDIKYLSIYLVVGIFIYLNWFIILIVNYINKPVEKLVFNYYKKKAKIKLESIPGLKKIGITGSYGKTSVKNIVNEILNVKYNSYATEKSFNTMKGLMLAINNKLDKYTDVFVAEMGAFKKGEIKEKAEFIKPDYGILTVVGTSHLESFKSRENIRDAKFELIEELPSTGVAILNMDDPYQVSYKLKNKCKVVFVSLNNKEADFYAKDIVMDNKGMKFKVYFKDLKKDYEFETKLLGKHNVSNILCGIAIGYLFGLSMEEISLGVKKIQSIEHRLELKKWHNIYLIDDAYNSNPVGAKMALDVLSLMPGKKIIVTPGMIELGSEQYNYNKEFGLNIAALCDEVILVGKEQTKAIRDGLKEANYNEKNIWVTNNVMDALNKLASIKEENTYVLLENDLPDIFNE